MKPVSALDIEKIMEGKSMSIVVHKCSREEKKPQRKKEGRTEKRTG